MTSTTGKMTLLVSQDELHLIYRIRQLKGRTTETFNPVILLDIPTMTLQLLGRPEKLIPEPVNLDKPT